jgi:hypothetical protein
MMACKNCRFGDHVTDKTGSYYMCRLFPPKSEVLNGADGSNSVVWVQPAMVPAAWCGQFKLAFWRWLKSFAQPGI